MRKGGHLSATVMSDAELNIVFDAVDRDSNGELSVDELAAFVWDIEPVQREISIQVTCPEGLKAGDEILVGTPDGRQFEAEVPDGVSPGDIFHCVVEEAEGQEQLATPKEIRARRRRAGKIESPKDRRRIAEEVKQRRREREQMEHEAMKKRQKLIWTQALLACTNSPWHTRTGVNNLSRTAWLVSKSSLAGPANVEF